MQELNLSLYLVTDFRLIACVAQRSLESFLEEVIEGGVSAVQLRDKESSDTDFVDYGHRLRAVTRKFGVGLIVNDRLSLVEKIGADGVHLGQSDADSWSARKLLGPQKWIGLSVENFDQLRASQNAPVDYVGVSAIFPTQTKSNLNYWGIEGLKKARSESSQKLVAIGGIDLSNAESVVETGADGLAVVSALCTSRDPQSTARSLRSLFKETKATL